MKNFFFTLLLMASAFAPAQNIRLEGTIKDSLGLGLEMANVMAVNKVTNEMESYAITNEAGKYQLLLRANSQYTLKASYIGYAPHEEIITSAGGNMVKDITLRQG